MADARLGDVALEEEDLRDLLLAPLLRHHEAARLVRPDEGLDDGGEIEELQVALELLRGGAGHLQRGGLEPLGQDEAEVPAEGRQRLHEVEEDGLLQGEQLRPLRRARRRRARRSGEERELAEHFALAEVGHGDGIGGVGGRRQDLEHARLHDVEPVALVALAEHDRPRAVVLHAALVEDGVQNLVRLVFEKIGGTQEARVDPAGHRAGLYPLPRAGRCPNVQGTARTARYGRYANIRPLPGGLPDRMVAKYLIRQTLSQFDRGMTQVRSSRASPSLENLQN